MNLNDTLHGFTVTDVRSLPEIGATMYRMVFTKNGAQLIWLDRDDSNMTYAIGFKTLPEDDTGVFHILEHSVLNGSDKFPLKEPFVNLLKGSMQTFLNAMTFQDKTMYPISSRNVQDYLNLMDVYTDAVFHPLIYSRPEIFMQEGWHYEWNKETGALTRSGVVFNEMKGAYADVDEQINFYMNRLLFPDNCYGYESGGEPDHIPELTYEKFLATHRKYYHPCNARIFLDGNVPIEKALALLEGYLKDYDASDATFDIAEQKPVNGAEYNGFFEAAPDGGEQGRLALGYVYGDYTEAEKSIAMEILSDVLCGSNEAPLRKQILQQGLAKDIDFHTSETQYLSAGMVVKDVAPENAQKVQDLIRRILEEQVSNGIDRKQLVASLNSMEFASRERDFGRAPRGLVYAISSMQSWLYGGDPAQNLCVDEKFKFLREQLDTGYFEDLIRTCLLENAHTAKVYLAPSATLGEERRAKREAELKAIADSWSKEQCDKVAADAEHLLACQQTPDSPEVVAMLPQLALSDVKKEPSTTPVSEETVDGIRVLTAPLATEGIIYTDLYFALDDLTMEELSAASFLSELMCSLPTQNYSTIELQGEIKTNLGRFGVTMDVQRPVDDASACTPYFVVSMSLLEGKRADACALTAEILNKTLFTDRQQVQQLLEQRKLQYKQTISMAGNSCAALRASASCSAAGAVNEAISGLDYYDWLCGADLDAMLPAMAALAQRIFVKERLSVGVTGTVDQSWAKEIMAAVNSGAEKGEKQTYLPKQTSGEGLIVPADIGFAAKCVDLSAMGMKGTGQMQVAAHLLSYDYLWNVIRVQNGAYGAGMGVSGNVVQMTTYRDPVPGHSLDCFDAAGDELISMDIDRAALEGAIIGAMSKLEPVMSPRAEGKGAIRRRMVGYTDEMLQQNRTEMLSTTREDLKAFGELLKEIMPKAPMCVVGGRNTIDACGGKLTSTRTVG